tara:strand:+ start:38 stop:385 length:348 start_codon:yes stop_codon:yes gene_type:complete
MDMKLLAQAAIMLATIAGGYAVVKAQLARVMSDLEDFIKRSEAHRTKFDARLDDAESQRAVFASRIDVLADINSVTALADLNRELERISRDVHWMNKQLETISHMHNGKHPKVGT